MDLRSTVTHKQWRTLPEGFWARVSLTEQLEEALGKQGMIV